MDDLWVVGTVHDLAFDSYCESQYVNANTYQPFNSGIDPYPRLVKAGALMYISEEQDFLQLRNALDALMADVLNKKSGLIYRPVMYIVKIAGDDIKNVFEENLSMDMIVESFDGKANCVAGVLITGAATIYASSAVSFNLAKVLLEKIDMLKQDELVVSKWHLMKGKGDDRSQGRERLEKHISQNSESFCDNEYRIFR